MPDLNNTEQLRKWFRKCPVLQPENRFRVNYLDDEATEYAIYSTPSTILYRENVLGEEVPRDIQTLNFIFASKEAYGADVEQNLESLGFYQAVTDWILERNAARDFPVCCQRRCRRGKIPNSDQNGLQTKMKWGRNFA